MNLKLYSFGCFVCLLFILSPVGCSDLSKPLPLTPTSIAIPQSETSSTPASLPVASPSPSPSPAKAISQWLLSGSYVQVGMDVPCASKLSVDSFILGASATTCLPAETDSVAEILVQAPPSGVNQIALLHIFCTDTANDCRQAVQLGGTGGAITITVDDQLLWRADCSSLSPEECGSRFLAETFRVAFAAANATSHHIQIKISPHVSWQIADIQITWHSVPQQINGVAFSVLRLHAHHAADVGDPGEGWCLLVVAQALTSLGAALVRGQPDRLVNAGRLAEHFGELLVLLGQRQQATRVPSRFGGAGGIGDRGDADLAVRAGEQGHRVGRQQGVPRIDPKLARFVTRLHGSKWIFIVNE